jgi:hypothetical protein
MPNVVFVAPFLLETTLRFIGAVGHIPDARVVLVSQDSKEKLPADLKQCLAAFLQVPNALDPSALAGAIDEVNRHMGKVDRLVGALEELQVPLALVRERFGIPGMRSEAAANFRDKARMKTVLRDAGVPCARHRLVGSAQEAARFIEETGFPVVVKPPAGAGARNTFRLDDNAALEEYLRHFAPVASAPTLFEEFIVGEEHSFDSVFVGGELKWHSVSHYHPTPLEVLRNPWIQWCVVLPLEIDGPEYDGIRSAGARALSALGMETGLSHMEWFRRRDGSVAVSEVAARPPGAQFVTLISYAHDHDFYRSWARLSVFDEFVVPPRRFAVGAVFLRGQGQGRVKEIHGLDQAQREVGPVVVESRLPRPGQRSSGHYEGDGYVIVRHPETQVVERAVTRILKLVQVELG